MNAMFLPVWFYLIYAALVVGAGALAGMLFGWVIGVHTPPHPRQRMLDAVVGGVALWALDVAINVADSHMTSLNGQVLGPRGLLLNHELLWAVVTITLAVGGRHLFAIRAARRAGMARPAQDSVTSASSSHSVGTG
jgi:hypothetical protein